MSGFFFFLSLYHSIIFPSAFKSSFLCHNVPVLIVMLTHSAAILYILWWDLADMLVNAISSLHR